MEPGRGQSEAMLDTAVEWRELRSAPGGGLTAGEPGAGGAGDAGPWAQHSEGAWGGAQPGVGRAGTRAGRGAGSASAPGPSEGRPGLVNTVPMLPVHVPC